MYQTDLVVVNNEGEARTTSLIIAEGLEVEHKAIIQLVRNYKNDLEEFGLLTFEMLPRPEGQHGGGNIEYALLNEQQSTLILTYAKNTEIARAFKKRLVKAFYELARIVKSTPQFHIPTNLPEALRLAADESEKRMIAEGKVKLLTEENAKLVPKAEALDKLVTTDGLFNLTHAAKVFGIQPRIFNKRLESMNWIYRMGVTGAWTGHAPKVKSGYMEHRIYNYTKTDGTEGTAAQVLITPKGMTKLAELLGVEQQEELEKAA